MKFTIGQRVRFYVSKEFLEGQDLSDTCSPGWVTGKITRIHLHPEHEYDLPIHVTLDSKTGVLPKYVNTLNFTIEGNFYSNMHNKNEGEQLTLQPLTILKRRHL